VSFAIGVDLGQAADYSTIAIVRSTGDELHLVHLHRFPLGTDYTVVVDGIVDVYEDSRLGVGTSAPHWRSTIPVWGVACPTCCLAQERPSMR
jgi:hypothetical protein